MSIQRILVPIAGAAMVVFAWRAYGWGGVALVVGGMLMWVLLHFTRLTQILKRAADRPVGYVDSAVMLHAKLRPNLTLLHVIGLTRSLGEQLSPRDAQPELWRWTDGSASSVTCEFANGKLANWTLQRPQEQEQKQEQEQEQAAGEPEPGR